MKLACYAAGVIGSSFAVNFAMKGIACAVYVTNEDRKTRSAAAIEKVIESLKSFNALDDAAAKAVRANILITTDPAEAFADVDLVQENAPENLELKQQVLTVIEQYAPADAIIASSTSSLSISAIAEKAEHPERCIGAHPFNPPHLIPLVEITKNAATTPEAIEKAIRCYKAAGKEPVVLNREMPGFIANRFQHAVLREVIALVTDGVCSLEDADKALTYGPGLRWAAIGQGMIGELASPDGAKAFNTKFKPASERIFRSLSTMTEIPEVWPDMSEVGIEEEKRNMPALIGQTTPEIAAFRDRVLIGLLQLHGKI